MQTPPHFATYLSWESAEKWLVAAHTLIYQISGSPSIFLPENWLKAVPFPPDPFDKIREMGAEYVAIKKGEHGCLLFGEDNFFSCPAYPLEDIHDPTGAGDTFAGGVAGFLAKSDEPVTFERLRQAVVYGSVLASFNVEAFSLERLKTVTDEQIADRFRTFRMLSQFAEI
ncbi:MAG: PfkB family carbohydrate kinase [Phormidesmis sp.]